MAGTKEGGKKAARTNLERHGADFFKEIGRKGGKRTGKKGFALNPALARIAGAKGGRNGHRGRSRKNTTSNDNNNIDDSSC